MKKFMFVDIETTGLSPANDVILEFAMIITDNKLNPIESYSTVINHTEYILQGMSHWAEQTHSASGLLDQVRTSKVTNEQVEKQVLEILARHFSGPERPVIAGSSVHFDKSFIATKMPNLNKRLHYRIIDCSSFMEALKIYNGEIPKKTSGTAHRALADITDSINYLKEHLERYK